MHKMVNGQKIELSKKEEEAIKAEWAENERKSAESKLKQNSDKVKRDIAIEKLKKIAGLTDEELKLLKL